MEIIGNKGKAGITDYAQHKLGDITYIEPVDPGKKVKAGEVLTGVESVKAASDIFAPVDCSVSAFNTALDTAPELVNKSPYEEGWIAELEFAGAPDTSKLMDAAAYEKYIAGLE